MNDDDVIVHRHPKHHEDLFIKIVELRLSGDRKAYLRLTVYYFLPKADKNEVSLVASLSAH